MAFLHPHLKGRLSNNLFVQVVILLLKETIFFIMKRLLCAVLGVPPEETLPSRLSDLLQSRSNDVSF